MRNVFGVSLALFWRNLSLRFCGLILSFGLSLPHLGCQLRLARSIELPTAESTSSDNSANSSSLSASTALSISPLSKNLMVGNSSAFSASGGTPPYTFSLASGVGTVDPATGLYTAPMSAGSAVLRATDSLGQVSEATVTVYPNLQMTPTSKRMTASSGTTLSFQGSGGVPPLSYSILSGPGSINSSSGLYASPTQSGPSSIRVTDAVGNGVNASVQNIRFRTDGTVNAAVYSSGSWYIGGGFSVVNPWEAPSMIGLDSSGNPLGLCSLQTGFNAPVNALAVSGTSLYVGGNFTTYQGNSVNYLAKLNLPDCTLDTTFSPPASNGFDTNVSSLVVSGTSLYVGGDFVNYRGVGNSAMRLAKLDLTSGVIDTVFSPGGSTANGFNGAVAALAVSGTSLYVGGSFNAYKGVANSANYLAKLDLTSGAIDTTFSPVGATANGFNAGSPVAALAVSGSSLYVGGSFTDYRGVANSANRLAKLDLTSGAIDATFSPVGASSNGFNGGGTVYALAVSGNSLYVGGSFTDYKGVASSANRLAKLDLTSGAIDTVFGPVGAIANGFTSNVYALAVSGNSLYVGGVFTGYKGVANSAKRLAKLNLTSGNQDTTFVPAGGTANGFNSSVYAFAVSGSSLYVGGYFNSYGGQSANYLAKLDGTTFTLDTTFSPPTSNGFNNSARALAISGNSLYVAGDFTAYKGVANSANYLAKLDLTSGAIDTVFSPVGATANGFNSSSLIFALAVSGTSLYVGGLFSAYKGVANSANNLAKLDLTTGAIDTTFSPVGATANGFNLYVMSLAVSGTSLYVGGAFTTYKGVANSASRLAKLNLTTGAIDTTFSPVGFNLNGFGGPGSVNALAVGGTSLYVGGWFTAYKGVANSANRLAKLNLTTGVIDTTFSPVGATANGFNYDVYALAISGSSLYVGGDLFTAYKGVANSANRLAKLDLTTGAIDTTFSPVGVNANGVSNGSLAAAIYVLAVGGSSLYVGGNFTAYRGTPGYYFIPVDLITGAPGDL